MTRDRARGTSGAELRRRSLLGGALAAALAALLPRRARRRPGQRDRRDPRRPQSKSFWIGHY